MPADDAQQVASKCLDAWTSGDFDTARSLLHDDVTFVGPLATTEGIDDYMTGVQGFANMVERADQKVVFGEGNDVCIIYDLVMDGPDGAVIPTAGWYRVHEGKIASVRVFFDTGPLGPPPGQ